MSTHSAGRHQLSGFTAEPIQVELSKLKVSSLIPTSIRDAAIQPTTCQIRMAANCPDLITFMGICCPPIVVKHSMRANRYDVIGNLHTFSMQLAKLPSTTMVTAMYTKANTDLIAKLIQLEILTNRVVPKSLPTTEILRLLDVLFPNEGSCNKQLIKRASFRKLFPQIRTRQQLALALHMANSQLSLSDAVRGENDE